MYRKPSPSSSKASDGFCTRNPVAYACATKSSSPVIRRIPSINGYSKLCSLSCFKLRACAVNAISSPTTRTCAQMITPLCSFQVSSTAPSSSTAENDSYADVKQSCSHSSKKASSLWLSARSIPVLRSVMRRIAPHAGSNATAIRPLFSSIILLPPIYTQVNAPSTTKSAPVVKVAAPLAKYTATACNSSGRPIRPSGEAASHCSTSGLSVGELRVSSVPM